MAIKQDTIDSDSGTGSAGRRALLVFVAVLVGGASLGLRAWGKGSSNSVNPKKDEDSQLLAPDHEGESSLEAASDAADEAAGNSEESPLQPPVETDRLTVTEGAPPLPVPDMSARGKFEMQQEEQLFEHVLKLQKQDFEMRERAMRAPSRVQEYAEAVQAQTAQNAQLLSGLSAAASDGDAEMIGEVAEPLRAIAAMRGLARRTSRTRSRVDLAAELTSEGQSEAKSPTQEKREFFLNGGAQLEPGRLPNTVQHPKAPFELRMGTVIPGVLVTGMNSEAPGQIVGQVTEDVLDSIRHQEVLVPQGSQVVGTYSASISQGQTRIQVAWVRLNFPNGTYLDLSGMSGADQAGITGFHDRVNRHFVQRLAAALMSSAFTVALKLTEPPGANRIGDAIHRGVGENVVELGVEMAREQGRIPPTLEIRPGYRFRIMVSKDIGFQAPYESRGRRHAAQR